MKLWRTACAATLCLGLAACASVVSPPQETSRYVPPERQILVMLHLPPQHFRPDENYGGGYDPHSGRVAGRRLAERLAGEHGLKLLAEWPMPALGVDCFVMEVSADDSPAHVVRRLALDPRIESAQPVNLFHTLDHADPLYPLQPAAKLWHLAELHQFATGKNISVAEIDTGVEVEHPDLRGQISTVENFVADRPYAAERHGTAVAGVIVARADDGRGIAGMAPHARLMALRACWEDPGNRGAVCNSFTLAKALQFALDRDVRLLNLSLTGPRDRLLERLLDTALARGTVIVAAVDPHTDAANFPASHPGVLAVADGDNHNTADAVLMAPGRDIPTTVPGGRWDFVAGSSFAAAHVTGLVALLREIDPHMQPRQVHDALIPARALRPANQVVAVDACAVMARATGACVCACAVAHEARSLPYH